VLDSDRGLLYTINKAFVLRGRIVKREVENGVCFKCQSAFEYYTDCRPAYGTTYGLANLVCKPCMLKINKRRVELGLAPHGRPVYSYPIHSDPARRGGRVALIA